ncbi:MAG: response regulator [Candidatus Omnitrophica bacterium]|nr:response regulator [Candidatus Omnitrophota bacterium]
MSKKRILIIDDEKDLCNITKLNLERTGEYDVTTAYSGREGLKKANAGAFDLVITDFKMPGMDGRQVLEALKAMRPHAPVVLFSVYHDDPETVTIDIQTKADGVIHKPIDHEQLCRVIHDVLGGQEPTPS